jgi:hypothetical protein
MAVTRWTRLGAIWLMSVGVLLAGLLGLGLVLALMEGFEAGYDAMDAIVVVVISTVAAAHIAAGVGVWRGYGWGALLGIVFAVIGLLFCVLGSLEEWFMLLPVACYVATLVVLVQATVRPAPSAG